MVEINKIKKGDFFSRISYGKILDTDMNNVRVINEDGLEWIVGNSIFEKEFSIHSYFTKEEKVTKTELAEIFISNPRIIMTVNFNKQIKKEDVVDRITHDLYSNEGGKLISKDEFTKRTKKIASDLITGENRSMIGRHYSTKDDFGRVHFTDMEVERDLTKDYNTQHRLIDPRTLQWIIVNNVKYILK